MAFFSTPIGKALLASAFICASPLLLSNTANTAAATTDLQRSMSLLKILTQVQIKAEEAQLKALQQSKTAALAKQNSVPAAPRSSSKNDLAILKALTAMQIRTLEVNQLIEQPTSLDSNSSESYLALLIALNKVQLNGESKALKASAAEDANYYSLAIVELDATPNNLALLKALASIQQTAIAAEQWSTDTSNPLDATDATGASTTIPLLLALAAIQRSHQAYLDGMNHAPVWVTKTLPSAKEAQAFTAVLAASDKNGDAITFTLIEGPAGLNISPTGLINWHPDFDTAGTHHVIVQALDKVSSTEQRFEISVSNTNRAPIFASRALSKALENQEYKYVIDAIDHDGDAITLRLDVAPPELTLNGQTLSWTPSFDDAGTYPVTLKVTDGTLETTQSFNLQVKNNNRLPTFTSSPQPHAYESVDYQYALKAEDADNEAIKLALLQGPQGMKLGNDNVLHWRPSFDQHGKHTIKVSAFDGNGTQLHSFTVSVGDTNREPLLEKIADQQLRAGKKFRYKLKANDADGSKLRYRLIHAPENMEINKKGKLYWKTGEADIGTHTVIVSVSDGELKMRRHFDIKVTAKP